MARSLHSVVLTITLVSALALLNSASAAILPPLKQPKWAELTPQQREILSPLSAEWDKLESYRRKKWLGIVQRYPNMSAEEQQRLQRRMKAWASLPAEDRKRAREQYKSLQKAPPEQREVVKQRWQEYESLPDAERRRLQQNAQVKPQPKSGAGKTTNLPKAAPGSPLPPAPVTATVPSASNEPAPAVVNSQQ